MTLGNGTLLLLDAAIAILVPMIGLATFILWLLRHDRQIWEETRRRMDQAVQDRIAATEARLLRVERSVDRIIPIAHVTVSAPEALKGTRVETFQNEEDDE